MSLKQKTVKGLLWSFLDSFGIYFIKFGFSIVIARTLSPSDYGLMGMIVIFISIADMLVESGFSMALIQKKHVNDIDLSTVFWFNLFIAIIIYFILFFSATIIADFFSEPILVKITKISAFNVVLASLRIVHLTILSKALNFKKQTFINFTAAALSGLTGVILALKGYAVWALVFQTLVGSIISTLGFWLFHKWWPKLIFSFKSLKSMFSFGSKILLQGVTSIIFEKFYFPFIGKYYDVASLGFYTFANRFYRLFIRNSAIAYSRVTFPAFSSINNDKARFNRNYSKVYRLLAFAMFPLSLYLMVISKAFVSFFLTDKWLPSVSLMQLFFIDGFFFSLLLFNLNTFNATGHSKISFNVDLLKKVLMFLSIFITYKFGIGALIIGQVTSSFLVFVLSAFVIQKTIHISLTAQIKELIPLIAITIILYIFNTLVVDKYIASPLYLLIIKTIHIPIIYLLFCYLLRLKAFYEFLYVFRDYLPLRAKDIIDKKISF